MEVYYGLNYKMDREENFEDLLLFLEKGFIEKKLALTLKPVQSLMKNEDGTYTLTFSCAVVTFKLVFTPGVEFEEVKPDGIKVLSKILIEGNILKHWQRDDSGRTLYHEYEFHPNEMIITTTAEGLKSVVKRYYKLKK